MADYTDQEIQRAVEKLVRSAVRRPYGTLGNRDVSTSWQDIQEAAVSTFLSWRAAPFYVVFLGAGRTRTVVGLLGDAAVQVIELVETMGRTVRPVDSIVSLNNARSALLALETAGSARTSGFNSIARTPAYQRYDRNLQKFIDDYGAGIKKAGTVVRTPQQARRELGDAVRQFKEQHAELKRLIGLLSVAISDYSAMNLPAALSTGVIERARQVMDERLDEIESLTPVERLEKLRDLTLDLLAARTVIRNFGNLSVPTTFLLVEGMGQAWADSTHPAVPASLTTTLPGPYALRVDRDVWEPTAQIDSELDVVVEGSLRFVLALGGSYVARVMANVAESYVISAGPTPPQNNSLEIEVNDGGTISTLVVSLTLGTWTAADIATNINAAITTEPIEARASFSPSKFTGLVDIAGTDPGAVTFQHVNTSADWNDLFVQEGDRLIVWNGGNAGNIYQVNVAGITASTLTCTRITGAGTTAELGRYIEVGSAARVVEIRIPDSYAVTAMANRTSIKIGGAGDPIKERTASTFGWLAGTRTSTQVVRAEDVVGIANAQTTSAFSDSSRLTVELDLQAQTVGGTELDGMTVRTTPGVVAELVVLRARVYADITVGGLSATLVFDELPDGLLVGDEVVIRGSTVLADNEKRGVVATLAGTTVIVTFTSSVSTATNVLVEVSPDLTALPDDCVVELTEGPNRGRYYVVGQDPVVRAALTVDRPIPTTTGMSGLPVLQVGRVGRDHVVMTSTDTTLSTRVRVDEGLVTNPRSAKALLFSGPAATPVEAVGQTPYFKFENWPNGLAVGDVLELYATQYNVPDSVHEIISLEPDDLIAEVSPPLPTDLAVQQFATDQPLPFARVRPTVMNSYDEFKDRAVAWLAVDQLTDRWVGELDRRISIVLAQDNPTIQQINDVRLHVQELLAILTVAGATAYNQSPALTLEYALDNFVVEHVPQVEVLLDTLKQRASDRAIDTLLEGRFSDFFGLSVDGMSYTGSVLESVRSIMRDDMPVSRTARPRPRVLGELEQPNFEFDQQDIDPTADFPDIPGTYTPSNPGDSY